MFKLGLLASSAMTAVTLLLAGAPGGAYAQTAMHAASRDANARFLCTYGNFLVSSYYADDSGSSYSYAWRHVAVRIAGHGQTVRRIKVMEAQSASTSRSAFTVGIYSNTASGLPGNPIAVGKGKIGANCGPVQVSIPRTTLKSNQKYWIEERTSIPQDCSRHSTFCHSLAGLYWEADPNAKHRAYVQTYHLYQGPTGSSSSSTSPWTKQTQAPFFRLK
ncbi:MAG TPA: hypothetical protein VKR31_13620 [Rhizomicrobium sp.]|nr:hypothetical protein [Rhizomicrobium sp.]